MFVIKASNDNNNAILTALEESERILALSLRLVAMNG
jgi:hypothetical protein